MTDIALNGSATITARTPVANAPLAQKERGADDMEMIRTAAKLTRDLNKPNPLIYWADFLASAVIGYSALFAAWLLPVLAGQLAAGIVAILALYRAGSFIHELTHIKDGTVPGFRLGWNLIIGIPMLVPSFMYEGVHNLHHAKIRYGTVKDPEYLPLALMKPWSVPVFVIVAALAPVALLLRYGVLTPLSVIIPPLRTIVVARYSGLVINPDFRRKPATGKARRNWHLQEAGACLFAIALMAGCASGIIPLGLLITYLLISSGSIVINQIRTLVAHLWENEGEEMSVTEQYLDSVNVPPPATLPALWAPVGLRYHALHHLLPGLPYHALGKAHKRLKDVLPHSSSFYKANYPNLSGLVIQLVRSTFRTGHK